VPRAELPRATALNALVMTAAGTVGPALAGLTAATLGLTVNFALNALGFAVVIACLASVRTDAPPAPAAGRQPLLRSVGAGLAVVGGHAGLRSVVTGYGLLLLLGPSPSVVLPLYAAQVLHVGGAELGALFSAVGAGTVLASSVQAFLGSGSRSRVFLAALAVWAGALVVFASSGSLLVCAAALLVHGAARNVVGTTAVTLMQLLSPDPARGRVMSLNTLLANGVRPLGDFGLSAAMAATSVGFATGAAGAVVGLYALAQGLRAPRSGTPAYARPAFDTRSTRLPSGSLISAARLPFPSSRGARTAAPPADTSRSYSASTSSVHSTSAMDGAPGDGSTPCTRLAAAT